MREIVAKYLKSPSPALLAQLTTEEQKFVATVLAKDKAKAKAAK